MKINKDWKEVFKRYSFITHLLIAISTVGTLAVPAVMDIATISNSTMLIVVAVLSLMGIVGSFINQQVEECSSDGSCKVDEDD